MDLMKDRKNVLNDPEVHRVMRKEYGDKIFGRMVLYQNDYYHEYEHKLYDYSEPPLKPSMKQ